MREKLFGEQLRSYAQRLSHLPGRSRKDIKLKVFRAPLAISLDFFLDNW